MAKITPRENLKAFQDLRLDFALLVICCLPSVLFSAWTVNEDAELSRAVDLQKSGALREARAAYFSILARFPNRIDVLSNAGLVCGQLGEYQQAITYFRRALKFDPTQTVVQFNLGLTDFEAHRFTDAATELAQVVKAHPDNLTARRVLALSLLKLNRLEEGIVQLETAIESDSADLDLACTLASAYLRIKQFSKAKSIIDTKLANSDTAEAHLVIGNYDLVTGAYREAIRELRRSQELNPQLSTLGSVFAQASALAGDREVAEHLLQEQVRNNPADFEAHAFLGWLYLESGRFDDAERLLERAADLKPGDVEIAFQLARVSRAKGNEAAAARLLERVLLERPRYTRAHVLLAQVYYRMKRTSEAKQQTDIVKQLDEEDAAQRERDSSDLGSAH